MASTGDSWPEGLVNKRKVKHIVASKSCIFYCNVGFCNYVVGRYIIHFVWSNPKQSNMRSDVQGYFPLW